MSFHLDHEHKGWIVDSAVLENSNKQQQSKITSFQKDTTLSTFQYQRPLTAEKKTKIDSALTDMVVDRLLPFSFVESESFKKLSNELEERYTVPGRKLIIKQLDQKYATVKDKLKIDMKGADVAITHDAWTSINTQSYDTVTAHYINDEWELKSAVLQTGHFPGSHTSENIAIHLQTTLDKWGITQPICVTDNAAKEKKAFQLLNLPRVGCYGHKINLIVKNGLGTPEINKLLAKGRAVVTFFHQSPLASNFLMEKQRLLLNEEAQKHKLIQDVATRWNSTLDMLERLCEQTPAIHATVLDESLSKKAHGLRHKVLSLDELVFANGLMDLLKPFKVATEMLSAENSPTHHLVLPIMKRLERALDTAPDDGLKAVKREMASQLQNRFSADQDVALLACLLCPSTKHLLFLSNDEREKAKQLLYNQVVVKTVKIKIEKDNAQDEVGNVQADHAPNLPTLGGHDEQESASGNETDGVVISDISNDVSNDTEPPCKVAKFANNDAWLDEIIFCGQEPSKLSNEVLGTQEVHRLTLSPTKGRC